MDYFEDDSYQAEYKCEVCKWQEKVEDGDPPCIYCEEYGGETPPKNFDYKKLRKDKLGY